MTIPLDDLRIGTAGWSMPADLLARADPRMRTSALQRYARVLPATEINSSFYRHHQPATYERWAASTPPEFRFATKLPKAITHIARLELAASLPVLDRFLAEVAMLAERRGPLLIQLPPSFAFDLDLVDRFLTALRTRWDGPVAVEPRHASWFTAAGDDLLVAHCAARVAADPAVAPRGSEPGGWPGLAYLRLHGSPRMYASSYSAEYVAELADRLRDIARRDATDEVWCIFDNTAAGAALDNARALRGLLAASPTRATR